MDKLKQVAPGAWAVLTAIVVACAAIIIWAPPHFWELLTGADWPHVAGVITLVGGSFVGVFVQWKKGGGAALALIGALVMAGALWGCGANPVRINAAASTIAAAALTPMRTLVVDDAQRQIDACDRDAACLDAAAVRSRSYGAAFDSVRLVVVAHREGVEIAALAEQGDAVRVALSRGWAAVLREYTAFVALLSAGGVDVSALMPLPEVE